MVDSAASLYASNFTVDELREIDAFYRLPVGQKLLQKSLAITQQSMQIGQDASRKAAEDLRVRLTDLLAPERAQNVTAVSPICFRQSISSSCSGKPRSIPTASA